MAITYANLFASLGKLIKHYNAQAVDGQTLAADVAEIEVVFENEDVLDAISGLNPAAQEAWESQHQSRRGTLAGYAQNRLTVFNVVESVGATSNSLSEVLALLIEDMNANAEDVNAGTPALGATVANGDNASDGTIISTLLLDRIQSPGSRQGVEMPPHHQNGDLTSSLIIAETLNFRVTQDSYADGAAEGSESIEATGRVPDVRHGIRTTEGTGDITTLRPVQGSTTTYLQNPDFETFTVTDTPDSWDIDAGAVTTNLVKETGASDVQHGSAALSFLGSGAATITISQDVSNAILVAGQRYWLTMYLKGSAAILAGQFDAVFKGTGYAAGAAETISVPGVSLTTSYVLYTCSVMMPLEIPSDFELEISVTSTLTSGQKIYVDDIGIAPVTYGAGAGFGVVRGATPFVRNDRWTIAATHTEGVIQKFFRQVFGIQLPSQTDASETIADSLAT